MGGGLLKFSLNEGGGALAFFRPGEKGLKKFIFQINMFPPPPP